MKRILVIRGGAIGDFILTLPAVKLLRDNFPSAHIEILGYKTTDPEKLFNAGLDAKATRAIDFHQGDQVDEAALTRLVRSAVAHNVTIAQDSKTLGASKTITQSTDTFELQLAPGDYVFFCSVPGHRQSGMQGTLTVR